MCLGEGKALGHGTLEWYASLLKGMILLHQGHYEQARALFTSGATWDVPKANSRPSLLTTEFLGDIHLEQDDAAPALKLYDEVFPKALALVPKGDIVAELRRRRAECLLLLGQHAEAYAEAKTGLEHCRELGDRYEEAATYRVLALSAAAVGRPSEAKQWFDQGFAYYDDIETPFEWGKLWMSYGDWLRGANAGEYADQNAALDAYHAAHEQFERMGAEAKLATVNAKIAELASEMELVRVKPAASADSATHAPPPEPARARRRPRPSSELDRRSAWARENFRLITRHKQVLDLLEDVAKLAATNSPILILGESGTGKELIADGIHRLSGRKGTHMAINCGALPREVIESELFGYVSGAFTGATRDKVGLFEACDGGTSFLDEVGDMPVELQGKLLRFLESGESRRIGSIKNISVDTRIVAATNRERAALERGERFRLDLYYRLAHAVVALPPLRHRGEDLSLLLDYFLEQSSAALGKQVELSPAARQRLESYAWPGNVRQLKSVLHRLVILATPGRAIAAEQIELEGSSAPGSLFEELEQQEKRRMREALAQARGVKADAARALGMSRTTFISKLKRLGLI